MAAPGGAPAASAGPPAAPAGPAGEYPPLVGGTRLLGTLALSLATFMNVLDSSIANVSIPAIAGNLGVSPAQGTWVITSFGIANAIALPLTGWLTQRFGAVRLFTTSVLMFVLASMLCGLATSLEMLIAGRVLQGFVAGPLMPLSQTLLMASYPRHQTGKALAFWGMTTLVAPVIGPLLGGWITDNFSWPWIFYINVPVGLFAAFLTWTIYHRRETPIRKLPIDRIGLALLVLWVGAMQLVLDKGKELDWFASNEIILLAVVAVVGFVVFLAWELTDAHPVVDLRLFGTRNFAFGVLATAVGYGLFFGNVVLLPLWLQQWMGYTATNAGMALAPVGLLAILMTPVVGRQLGTWDPRWMATVAYLIFSLVMWLRSGFTPQTDLFTILVPTVLQGAALALFFIPLTAISFVGVPPQRLPAAAGLSTFLRITAGAMGTSITTTLWESRAQMHHAHLVETLGQGNTALASAMQALTSAGLTDGAALAQLTRMIDQQAYTRAADDIFLSSAVIFIGLIGLIWLTRRPPRLGAPAVDAGGAH
jgi:MFS transporter, DHA2 family, multidrug resistance protein